MKKLLNLFFCLALALHLNACTSNDSKDESEDGAVAEDTLETESADAALESEDGESTEQPAVAENNDGFLDEQLPEDALGESTPSAEVAANTEAPPASTEEAPPADMATVDASSADGSSSVASEPPAAPEAAPVMDTPATDSFAAVDTGTSSESVESTPPSSSSAASTSSESEEKPKPVASLKKVEMVPFKRSGVLLNAVYIARPGDSFSTISKNIYGNESKVKELKKVNPYFSKVKPTDKVYYNSPVRPTDDTKVLTYYEDSGMMPETYIAKEGDNLKTIAPDLVGYKDGWKEIWVTNSVDSKGELTAGTELKFWRTVPVAAAPPPAETSAPPADMAASTPPPPSMAQNEMPPAPPMPPSDMGVPPPAMDMPPPDSASAASMQDLPPPPPAEAVNPPPPPPPAPVVAKKAPQQENIGGLDNDMIMTLGGAGILVAAIALLMIMRKRRQQKEMSAAFGDTHVGT